MNFPIERSTQRLIVGISGASGAIYGVRLLELLKPTPIETHLVISRAGAITIAAETDYSLSDVRALADVTYKIEDIGAAISSGSFKTMGMVVAPCSIKSLSEIATGITSSLLTRAADVVLKEKRRLVLMVRETPLHLGHLRTMAAAAELGALVAPPVPAFYNRPGSIDDIVNHTLGRVLDHFDVDVGVVRRWKEPQQR
jgi:4-hydroxy-3-polyprenylbenzoate decarboxylase